MTCENIIFFGRSYISTQIQKDVQTPYKIQFGKKELLDRIFFIFMKSYIHTNISLIFNFVLLVQSKSLIVLNALSYKGCFYKATVDKRIAL